MRKIEPTTACRATLNKSLAAVASWLWAVCFVANARDTARYRCALRLAAHPKSRRANPQGLIQRRPRDFKRESKGQYQTVLDTELKQVIAALARDVPLPDKYQDHGLVGKWKSYRDCHVLPDRVLIYRLMDGDGTEDDPDRLVLARLGSHSELNL